MPVDGIGSKIMLNRAPDAARDASAMQRRSDLVTSQLDRQAQTEAEQMAAQVVDVSQAEATMVQRERERERRQQQRETEDDFLEYELSDEEMAVIEAEFQRARSLLTQTNADVGKPPIKKIDIRI